jgi:predicted N-acetyltransferase YhbS
MSSITFSICSELASHKFAVETLNEIAFGPGRYTRTAYRLREGVPHEMSLSFVALLTDGKTQCAPVGSVRQSMIRIGGDSALMLGPLVVSQQYKNLGIGRELMHRTLHVAREQAHKLVILVGDLAYYSRFGFRRVPAGQITLPGPVDTQRLLYHELHRNCMADYSGIASRFVQKCNAR